MKEALRQRWQRLQRLLRTTIPETTDMAHRIRVVERNIVLPAKAAMLLILAHSFQFSPWIQQVSIALEVGIETTKSFYWVYAAVSVLVGLMVIFMDRFPLVAVQWIVITANMVDAIFLAGMTLVTGGYDSMLFWMFVVLIVRNAVLIPLSPTQLLMNLFTSGCYMMASLSDFVLSDTLDEWSKLTLDLQQVSNPVNVLAARVGLLVVLAVCAFGLQLLLELQRVAMEEAREFAVREAQLHSTGRLAAEIAHQLKNPLAIITNASFSLRRALDKNDARATAQVDIIREEVERADRILTQVMGYAQLREGRVEKLDVADELTKAIDQVFPTGVDFPTKVVCDLHVPLPPLLMQRGHFSEIILNLLKNAREATEAGGTVRISAHSRANRSLEIVVSDDGPGIAPDRVEQVFEAYYTTKDKGTGLGLSIVKRNVDLYGGKVEVESELGKGARFTLTFPSKTLMTPVS